MRLGPMRRRDRTRVNELLDATAVFSVEEVGVALELFDTAFQSGAEQSTASGDYEFVGMYGDDQLLGYACFGPTPGSDGTFDLYWLAVDPAAQGQGGGSALMTWVEKELDRRAARLLVVETSSRTAYARTRAFYARRGYVEAARVRDFYAPLDDRIILTTRLTPRDVGALTR